MRPSLPLAKPEGSAPLASLATSAGSPADPSSATGMRYTAADVGLDGLRSVPTVHRTLPSPATVTAVGPSPDACWIDCDQISGSLPERTRQTVAWALSATRIVPSPDAVMPLRRGAWSS